jgi:transcriptional regulator with XRE-family HTH domain
MTRGEVLRKFRLIKGLTQKEIAEKLEMTHSAYAKYERDEVNMPIMNWVKLCDILGIPFSYGEKTDNEIEYNALISFEFELQDFVKTFIENKENMSPKQKTIARELFEEKFYSVEKDKERLKKAIKPSNKDEIISWLGLEFLYKDL